MKISEIFFAVPFAILFIIAHIFYVFLCFTVAAWVHVQVDEFRGKLDYDPFCGIGFLFVILWIISTSIFCGYWGNKFYVWGY
jgi:hypothetical protein